LLVALSRAIASGATSGIETSVDGKSTWYCVIVDPESVGSFHDTTIFVPKLDVTTAESLAGSVEMTGPVVLYSDH
jgi:hypothetical protein